MINQSKRPVVTAPKYYLQKKQSKPNGKKITKVKQIKSKIYKNLSNSVKYIGQIPIVIMKQYKQPQKQDIIKPKNTSTKHIRATSAMSNHQQNKDQNKKRLSLDSANKYYQRDSASKQLQTRKITKSKIIDEGIKQKIHQQRKKINLSSLSGYQQTYDLASKKNSIKNKRPSSSSLVLSHGFKGKQNKDPKKQKNDYTPSKSKNKRKKSQVILDKSKTSIPTLNQQKIFIKKKKSIATVGIRNNQKKKKIKKQQNSNIINEQFSIEQYPISKYDIQITTKKQKKQLKRSKSKSNNSHKKQIKQKPIIKIDYNSCVNFPSNSSQLIQSRKSEYETNKIKILDNFEYMYSKQSSQSMNLQQIRYYQLKNDKCQTKNTFNKKKYNKRQKIEKQICQDFPNFQEIQLRFLTSVIFIQRKWRQINKLQKLTKFYYKHTLQKIKQISSSPQKENSYNSPKLNIIKQSIIQQQNNISNFKQQQIKEDKQNTITNQQLKFEENQKKQSLSSRSYQYQFLQKDIFPSFNYINLLEKDIKRQTKQKIHSISHLQIDGYITMTQFVQFKKDIQRQCQKQLQKLNSSRKHIKKGFLKFIETYKCLRQGLKRVSSQSGPMASIYTRIFTFQASSTPKSDSSESLKRLSKRILIRKQFFKTQKIQPEILRSAIIQALSARQQTYKKSPRQKSARISLVNSPLNLDYKQNESQKDSQILQTIYTPLSIQHKQYPKDIQKKQKLILQQIIAVLTFELYSQLVKIDDLRENNPYITDEDSIVIQQKEDKPNFTLGTMYTKQDLVLQQQKLNQICNNQFIHDVGTTSTRKPRHSNKFYIASSITQNQPFQQPQLIKYCQKFFQYLKKQNLTLLVKSLNQTNSFTAFQYLRFLRGYQDYEEEYNPLIPNSIFMDWQDICFQQDSEQINKADWEKRQTLTVFHRCVFQAILFQLQKYKINGERGVPFPWQNPKLIKKLKLKQLPKIFEECLTKLKQILSYKCGLIEQHELILNEQDFERVHEENEDRIINALQKQLEQLPDNWYEIEEHGLEVRLQIQIQIIEYLILETIDDLLQHI